MGAAHSLSVSLYMAFCRSFSSSSWSGPAKGLPKLNEGMAGTDEGVEGGEVGGAEKGEDGMEGREGGLSTD